MTFDLDQVLVLIFVSIVYGIVGGVLYEWEFKKTGILRLTKAFFWPVAAMFWRKS